MTSTQNRKWFVRLAALVFWAASAQASVELGIDVLASHDYSLLQGKRVGLITNQTGVNSDGVKTRLLLKLHCKLVALYTPEHGLDLARLHAVAADLHLAKPARSAHGGDRALALRSDTQTDS